MDKDSVSDSLPTLKGRVSLRPNPMNMIIKSISNNQSEIIQNVINLYIPEQRIDCDPTFSKGNFYKNVQEPIYKLDISPSREDVTQADCRKLPFEDSSIKSIMFDPPFSIGTFKKVHGIIKDRFGFYKTPSELLQMYYDSMDEFVRILKKDGILIFKCQDAISGGKQYMLHVDIINYARKLNLNTEDLFVLLANNRIMRHDHQLHARKYHSYFIVFKK